MLKKDAGGSRAAMKRKKKSLSVNMETAPSGKGAKKSKPSLAASSSSSSSSSAGGATDRTTERTKVSEYVVKYDEPDIRGKSVLDILGLDEPDEVLSQAKANMLLSKIITPTTRESFYKESWETAPLHIERDSSAHFKGLFNKKSFTSILENQTSYLGEDIEINKYANGTLKTLNGQVAGEVDGAIMLEEEATVREGQQVQKEAVEVKRADIFAHLKENYTVRLLCPQKYDDLLWGFLAILEQEFGSRVGCHAGKFEVERSYRGYYSMLVVSCFMWSGALDSSDLFLSHPLMSLSSHITIILISTLKYTYLYAFMQISLLKGHKALE